MFKNLYCARNTFTRGNIHLGFIWLGQNSCMNPCQLVTLTICSWVNVSCSARNALLLSVDCEESKELSNVFFAIWDHRKRKSLFQLLCRAINDASPGISPVLHNTPHKQEACLPDQKVECISEEQHCPSSCQILREASEKAPWLNWCADTVRCIMASVLWNKCASIYLHEQSYCQVCFETILFGSNRPFWCQNYFRDWRDSHKNATSWHDSSKQRCVRLVVCYGCKICSPFQTCEPVLVIFRRRQVFQQV